MSSGNSKAKKLKEPGQPKEPVTRADAAFKRVTGDLAQQIGLRLQSAELPQTLSADFILEVPPGVKLATTLFSFLADYEYAVLDFKGQSDPLDMDKLLTNSARTSLFCSKYSHDVRKVLNLLVCSRYPQDILRPVAGVTGFSRPDAEAQPWLWVGHYSIQEVAIVVCRDLPLGPPYYDWLAFAPADSVTWKAFVRLALKDGRRDLLEIISSMRPKEFKAMAIDYMANVDPKDQARIDLEWFEVLEEELPRLKASLPEAFEKFTRRENFRDFQAAVAMFRLEQLIETIGVEQLAETLTDEQLEEILRRRRKNKSGDLSQ